MNRKDDKKTIENKTNRKIKFLGRHLMVKGEYVNDIISGRKKATIRLGFVKLRYNELIVHGGGRQDGRDIAALAQKRHVRGS